MKKALMLIFIVLFTGCSSFTKNYSNNKIKNEPKELKKKLRLLSSFVKAKEAEQLSNILFAHSKKLAIEYKISTNALLHNTLINMGFKNRGFCYHYNKDLIKELKKYAFESFDFYWAVHKRGLYWEHNALLVSAKTHDFNEGIILDAWRNTGNLFFKKVSLEKKYEWSNYAEKTRFYFKEQK